jgi:hypothetical protein
MCASLEETRVKATIQVLLTRREEVMSVMRSSVESDEDQVSEMIFSTSSVGSQGQAVIPDIDIWDL